MVEILRSSDFLLAHLHTFISPIENDHIQLSGEVIHRRARRSVTID